MTTVDALPRTWRPQTAPAARSTSSKFGGAATSTQPLRWRTWCGGCQFHSVTVNAWLPDGSYPIEAITLADTAEFQDFSWSHGYEGEMPLNTPAKEVAGAVQATLPAQERPSVLVSLPPVRQAGVSVQRGPRLRHAVVLAAVSTTSPARQRKRSTPAMTIPTNPYAQAYSDFLGGAAEHQTQQAETSEAVPA